MRDRRVVALIVFLGCLTASCKGSIELVGYGIRPGIQHGLKVELLNVGPSGAMVRIENKTKEILSVNQCPQAMVVSVKRRTGHGLVAAHPCERVMIHMRNSPHPDDFVILAPGQTRDLPVPVSYEADRYRAFDRIYRIEKGNLYEVGVRLMPYFGAFTEKTASQTLAGFRIPNYLREPLTMNTMTIRAR